MESVLVDRSLLNPRKNVVNNSSSYGGFMTRPYNTFSSSSASQLFLNLNAGTGGRTASYGYRPPPSRYSSLPSFSGSTPSVVAPPYAFHPPPPPPLHQPPLLPLPLSKSSTLPSPSPTKRIAAAVSTARSRDNRNKTKPDSKPPRKEARSSGTPSVRSDPPKGESVSVIPQKSAKKPATPPAMAKREEKVKEGGEEEEKFAMEAVYSFSPPPSSLPLPTFFLKGPKSAAAATSCVAEAMGCGDAGGGRVNAGATDDLRRLLRL